VFRYGSSTSPKKKLKKIEKRLEEEIIKRKDLEKSIAEEDAKSWKSLYLSKEKALKEDWKYFEEKQKKYEKWSEEERKENYKLREVIMRLRWQLEEEGKIPREKHDIDDEEKRREAIREVKLNWRVYSKNGKINRKTITEILWENWEKVFDTKEEEDIIIERDRLINIIVKVATKK
jgi:hypothetical protein